MTTQPSKLLNSLDLDQVRTILIGILQSANDPITDWNDGAVRLTQMQYAALGIDKLVDQLFPLMVGSGYLGFIPPGQSGFVDIIAEQIFNLTRSPAVLTQQMLKITSDGTHGPYTAGNDFYVINPLTGNRYFAITTGTLTTGAPNSITITVQAEGPNDPATGAYYGDGPNTLTKLGTPWTGVTCSNVPPNFSGVVTTPSPALGLGVVTLSGTPPALATAYDVQIVGDGQNTAAELQYRTNGGPWGATTPMAATISIGTVVVHFTNDPGGSNPSFRIGDVYSFSSPGSAILQSGVAAESDVALIARCYVRWPDLSGIPVDRRVTWAKQANPAVKRVSVLPDAVIGGRMFVTIAGAPGTATLGAGVVSSVQSAIDQQEGIGRFSVVAAAATTTITATNQAPGQVTVPAAKRTNIEAAANLAWSSYVDSTDIGGIIRAAKLVEILVNAGAIDVTDILLNGSPVNVILPVDHVALAADLASLTWVEV